MQFMYDVCVYFIVMCSGHLRFGNVIVVCAFVCVSHMSLSRDSYNTINISAGDSLWFICVCKLPMCV